MDKLGKEDLSRVLFLIPTFNEAGNVSKIARDLAKLFPASHLLFIDDGSKDGTLDEIGILQDTSIRVHSIIRTEKLGLGRAYLDGFKWGLKNNFEVFIQMDADGSHQVADMKDALTFYMNSSLDAVIGSRWILGGSVSGWSFHRHLLSRIANKVSNQILRLGVSDSTSGFRLYSRGVVERAITSKISSTGYAFQIEMTSLIVNQGMRVQEFPIEFLEREVGKSKMNFSIILEAQFFLVKKYCQRFYK